MDAWRGRLILAPKDNCPPGTTTLFINIGGVLCGSQAFPVYSHSVMQFLCTPEEYDKLVLECKAFFLPPIADTMCCRSLLSWSHISQTRPTLDLQDLEEIVTAVTETWRTPGKLVVCDEVNVASNNEGSVALTDLGSPLMLSSQPIWPPVGINLVFKVSGTVLREHWTEWCQPPTPIPTPHAFAQGQAGGGSTRDRPSRKSTQSVETLSMVQLE